jgi:cation diffusion facilitator family transporter
VAERLTTADAGTIKRNALRISLIAISSVFAFEFIAGFLTNSLALVTDGTHALLDAVVTAVLIIATTLALKPRDIDHTYGHGKIETIGGFIGGVALFVIAIFFIYEATVRIAAVGGTAPLVKPGTIGFAAVIYTLAVDGFRITILRRAMKKTDAPSAGVTTLKADFYHAFADLASTTVALVGLWLVSAGFGQGDSIAAIILGGFLAYLSSRFAYQNAMELTDVISPKLVATVRQAANATEGVLECKDIKMRRVGREIFVEATIALHAEITFEDAHGISAQVEDNIAKSLSGSGLDVKPEDITVHFEPIDSTDLPPESLIEKAASRVRGVKGVHNILVSRIGSTDSVGVSLHIQVNRTATLTEAHAISNAVEDSIKGQLKGVDNITVHLEPLMPEIGGMEPVADNKMQDSIREIILGESDIKKVGKIATYRTAANILKIDADCAFSNAKGDMTIEQIHERVSEIEKQIRARYPGSIVTIHAEPS